MLGRVIKYEYPVFPAPCCNNFFFFSIFFFPFQGDINLLPRVLSLEVEREDPGNEVEAILVTAELPVLCDVFFFQFINYFVQIIRHVCIHLRSICLK